MAANARRNDEMNRKRIIMPCTPSAPSTQSSMPLLLLGPPPYRILNILAYYRWSLALPSTLRKGISSVASSSPPCLDERRILFLCPPLDSSTSRLSYRRGDSCQASLSLTSVGPVPTSHFTTLPLRDYCTAIFNQMALSVKCVPIIFSVFLSIKNFSMNCVDLYCAGCLSFKGRMDTYMSYEDDFS